MDYYRQQELPQTYQQYKKATEKFSEWLVQTAIKRNIETEEYLKKNPTNKPKMGVSRKGQTKEYILRPEAIVHLSEEIAASRTRGAPLVDTSGLAYLEDAIRRRKEVGEYFKVQGQADAGHSFFNNILRQAQSALMVLSTPWARYDRDSHDIPDERPSFTFFDTSDPEDWDDESSDDKCDEQENVSSMDSNIQDNSTLLRKKIPPTVTTFSPTETIMEQDFQVLCFLYDFNQLRGLIRRVWEGYKSRIFSLITASLITDLALGIIRRDVTALEAEVKEVGGSVGRSLWRIMMDLHESLFPHETLSPPDEGGIKNNEQSEHTAEENHRSPEFLSDPFCGEARLELEEHLAYRGWKSPDGNCGNPGLQLFLLFFCRLKEKLNIPLRDNFTEAMLMLPSSPTSIEADPFLICGLQVILDIQKVTGPLDTDIFEDTARGLTRTVELMRNHMDYEDQMWALGSKPEYMTVGETKFSNIFLAPSIDILNLMNQILDKNIGKSSLRNSIFLCDHPVLGGLTLYHFKRMYNMISIAKVQWFLVAFAHLYNACKQVGGLTVPWPDLEYIIETQGTNRIFPGGIPVDPQTFLERLLMGMQVSARGVTQDHIQRHRRRPKWRKVSRAVKAKRGFRMLFPFQEKVKDYYYNHKQAERWIRLHNVLAHASNTLDTKEGSGLLDKAEVQSLNAEFTDFINKMLKTRKKKKRKQKQNKSKVKAPELSLEPSVCARLLSVMTDELQEHELHTNFDYLSFYRRAMNFVQGMRDDILFDVNTELQSLEMDQEDPTNYHLLIRLFQDLKINPKSKNVKATGNELSKDVVALGHLQQISQLMETLILDEGREELNKAEKLLGRWWVEKKRQYAKRPKGLFHTFTYGCVVSRKHKLGILRHVETGCDDAWFAYKCGEGPYTRLVGKRKRRVMFPCRGECPLGNFVRGVPSWFQRPQYGHK